MSYAKTLLPVTFIKQTLFPISKNLRYINQGSIDRGIIKFKPTAEELKARITRYCKPNYTRIIRSTTAIKDAIVPVRFCPEPSMHHASCTDFSKTRLHSLPITKSPENPANEPGQIALDSDADQTPRVTVFYSKGTSLLHNDDVKKL